MYTKDFSTTRDRPSSSSHLRLRKQESFVSFEKKKYTKANVSNLQSAKQNSALRHLLRGNQNQDKNRLRHLLADPEYIWEQVGQDIPGAGYSNSGRSVSLSSDGLVVAVGAPSANAARGLTQVYMWNGLLWTQMGLDIVGEVSGDQSGYVVSLSGDGQVLAIGACLNDGNGSLAGHTRVYKWVDSLKDWKKMGQDIDGEAGDYSGWSVSLSSDGQVVAIGAPNNDDAADNAGHVRVYHLMAPETTTTTTPITTTTTTTPTTPSGPTYDTDPTTTTTSTSSTTPETTTSTTSTVSDYLSFLQSVIA